MGEPRVDPLLAAIVRRISALEAGMGRGRSVSARPVACTIYGTSPTTVANNVLTQVALDSVESEGVSGMADTANNRIVAPADGLYIAIATAEMGATPANGRRDFRIYRQPSGSGLPGNIIGIDRASNSTAADSWQASIVTRLRPLSEGDAVLLYADHVTAAGNANVDVSTDFSPFLSLIRWSSLA